MFASKCYNFDKFINISNNLGWFDPAWINPVCENRRISLLCLWYFSVKFESFVIVPPRELSRFSDQEEITNLTKWTAGVYSPEYTDIILNDWSRIAGYQNNPYSLNAHIPVGIYFCFKLHTTQLQFFTSTFCCFDCNNLEHLQALLFTSKLLTLSTLHMPDTALQHLAVKLFNLPGRILV